MDMIYDVNVALAEVPVNLLPLLDDTDFKTRETAVAHNAAGMDLVWNFITTAGAYTQTAVTPSNSGNYLWTHKGDGMYAIQIPASGGASINNNATGFGFFTGVATGVLPWRGPVFMFRAAALNDALIDGGDLLDVSVTQWLGVAVATPDSAGHPKVTLKTGTGAGELAITSGRVQVQSGIRKNQALLNYPFLMTDSTNHNPITGLTGSLSGSRSIDGAAPGALSAPNFTEIGNGLYQLDLSASDMNGDTIVVRLTAPGADDLSITFVPLP